ncbi:tryptophan synthase [Synchytrium endobioticum]|uniref:Tryptophan synthase n=1 Tax=Synchytrium endobioticum TaxID=286115 RepID=A0A507CQH7_9FUNG|nr:tryptophan synthase [Synchytrium endobioticum]TPX51173.1 tryptophan synthase [Synchytrium endobioticum]
MSLALANAFREAKAENKPVFVAFVTAGFPEPDDTVEVLLALQEGGADIIELGVPFSDPIADGPTIQAAGHQALKYGIDIDRCIEFTRQARYKGLTIPVLLMGYYNPFLNYGEAKLLQACRDVGISGFIVVDLPPEESVRFRDSCAEQGLSYVPMIAPSTTESRIKSLVTVADTFIYVVSTMGVTGARDQVNQELPNIVARIRKFTDVPLAVGFGVASRHQFQAVAQHADGVVIGSQIITTLSTAAKGERAQKVKEFALSVTGLTSVKPKAKGQSILSPTTSTASGNGHLKSHVPTKRIIDDRFGQFGGQYAPEALVDCLDQIEKAFVHAQNDASFWHEFKSHYQYMGRPSSLHVAERLTQESGGARIWLKREDLNHTGSHKINNALAQVLLARRLHKTRIIAETGAGQHGVATATVCAKFGLGCTIYMGAEDVRRQALNVFRIRMLGAAVIPVDSGSRTLKDAINQALRDWVANVDTTHYVIGSAIGPHPFPTMVREFQAVIGRETKAQMMDAVGRLPDAVVACVGGGSNAIGMFHPFLDDAGVRIVGVEAAGDGMETGRHSATLSAGRPGVLHGTRTYLMQDANGQILETHSISAGLDYPGVGPEHAWMKDSGRAEYVAVSDKESLIGFRKMCELEGIIPALETAHAIYYTLKLASAMKPDQNIVLCLSGRGDKDVVSVAEHLPKFGHAIGWDLRFEGNIMQALPSATN